METERPLEVITGTALSDLCDYSFGDHLGGREPHHLIGGFMKYANEGNLEFLDKCREFEGKAMTLFIDNIRLYPRSIYVKAEDGQWITHLMGTNNLLALCGILRKNKFVIFTSHEDTPIDDQIVIPDNVLGIHAANAAHFGGKIHPFPYGVQRAINRTGGDIDNRIDVLKQEIGKVQLPTKLLYINCGIARNKDRRSLADFEGLPWATTRFNENSMYFPYSRYRDFLLEMRDHKFMACPEGNGMDCHRNWESLYMRRVPVMKKSAYFSRLMDGFPVLFVDEWSDMTPALLGRSECLFAEAQKMNLNRLDLNLIFKSIVSSYETDQQQA